MKTELSNVVIVGKPNVGKSTLFNRLIQKKVAITSEIAGTTRDRIVHKVEWLNRKFNLIDTGGLTKDVTISFQTEINMQVEIALQYADLIVFVVSTKDGITAEDEYVAKKLKQYDKKVVLVANKADNKEMTVASSQFYKLGFGAPIPISSVHGINTSKLLDEIIKNIKTSKAKDSKILRIGIIGKPNVGKSTFLNKLLNEDRVIVSDVAGTTRDSIDTQFSIDGNDYILVDTAGIKKNKRALDDIAFYSELRSNLTVETSDIIFLVLDNSQGLQHIDESILQFLKESYKPTIALINKSDLLTEAKKKEIELEIENSFRFASYVPTIFISAKTGKGFNKIFELVEKIKHAMKLQIDQTTLNKFVRELLFIKQPPRQQGRHVSIDSIQFENKKVPTFEIYSNNPDFVHFSYQRFLEKQLRLIFDLEGIPIRVVYRRT